jgi:hypothetical protein
MNWTIETPEQMQQTLEQLSSMYVGLAELRRRVEPVSPRNFALLAESYVETIRRLTRELDDYAGVPRMKRQVARRSRRTASIKKKHRRAATR